MHIGLRIVAAACIFLWLQATSHCAIEQLFGDDHHHAEAGTCETLANDGDHSQEAEAAEHAQGEANHPQDSEQPSHDSHRHNDGDDCCCSTVIATAQIATPIVIFKPALEPLNLLCTVLQTHSSMLTASADKTECHAKPRDRVFTPEVCLDPAHRSLAPPSLA